MVDGRAKERKEHTEGNMGACVTTHKKQFTGTRAALATDDTEKDSAFCQLDVDRFVILRDALLRQKGWKLSDIPRGSPLLGTIRYFAQSKYATIFSEHPNLFFSNRAALLSTREFIPGEVVGKYRVIRSVSRGTVGRGCLATAIEKDTRRKSFPWSTAIDSAESKKYVFKSVTFVTRTELMRPVLDEHATLTELNHENVLSCTEVLNDPRTTDIVFVTPKIKKGNCETLVGNIENETKLLGLLHDIIVGLRILHSHCIYHLNLKPGNVLIRHSGVACIVDAGFGSLFISQDVESLVFNGELACMPPEVFLARASSSSFSLDASKVDIWGLGVLMYRLVYGRDPLKPRDKRMETVQRTILHEQVQFPPTEWSFDSMLSDVMQRCLNRDPAERPSAVELLFHPLFESHTIQNMRKESAFSSFFNSLFATPTVTERSDSAGPSGSSLFAPCLSDHPSNGPPLCVPLGKGRHCETFLLSSSHHASTRTVLKVMRRSVLGMIEAGSDAESKRRDRKSVV